MAEIDPLARLIYDEAVRGLNMQSETLDEVRSRTGVLIGAATVGSAFLGATALEHHHATYPLNLAGLIAFGVVVLLCLFVLWPSTKWAFVYSAEALDDDYFAAQIEPTQACRSIALGHAANREANKSKLKWRYRWSRFACVGLTIDIAVWLLSIGVR